MPDYHFPKRQSNAWNAIYVLKALLVCMYIPEVHLVHKCMKDEDNQYHNAGKNGLYYSLFSYMICIKWSRTR